MAEDRGAAIDVQTLDELEHSIGDDREFLRELVGTYLDDGPKQVEAMRAGLAEGNVEVVNRAVHTLKSNSASVGALPLAQLCRELEAMTLPHSTDAAELATPEIAARSDAIADELERVIVELDALVPAPESV